MAGLNSKSESLTVDDIADWLKLIVETWGALDFEMVLDQINADRIVSKFPPIELHTVTRELGKHRDLCNKAIKDSINKFKIEEQSKILTSLVESVESNGQLPVILIELIENLEIEFKSEIDKKETTVFDFLIGMEKNTNFRDFYSLYVVGFEKAILEWRNLNRPFQKICLSQNVKHERSFDTFSEIQDFTLEFAENKNLVTTTLDLLKTLKPIFGEFSALNEEIEEDIADLEKKNNNKDVCNFNEVHRMCDKVLITINKDRSSALFEAPKLIDQVEPILTKTPIRNEKSLKNLENAKNKYAQTLYTCVTINGRKANKWPWSINILSSAQKFATDKTLGWKINTKLREARHKQRGLLQTLKDFFDDRLTKISIAIIVLYILFGIVAIVTS